MSDGDEKSEFYATPTPDYDQFFLNIGKCVAVWTEIESRLYAIFKLCLGFETYTFSGILFDNIDSLEAKFNIVTEMLRCDPNFKPPTSGKHEHAVMKEWLNVKNNICEKRYIRNIICHHPVLSGFILDKDVIKEMYLEISITEAAFARGREVRKRLKIKDLENYHIEMWDLRNKLCVFMSSYVEYTLASRSKKHVSPLR